MILNLYNFYFIQIDVTFFSLVFFFVKPQNYKKNHANEKEWGKFIQITIKESEENKNTEYIFHLPTFKTT